VEQSDTTIELPAGTRCGLAILSIGGQSIATGNAREWFERIGEVLPEVPRVVVSDRDAAEDAVAAFTAGARGYVPTSIDPSLAILAFEFILAGGSFFPPTALLGSSANAGTEQQEPGQLGSRQDTAPSTDTRLTPRQEEVHHLLGEGKSNKVIARELGTSESTVKVHVRQIMRKLGVSNRTQAALSTTEKPEVLSGPRPWHGNEQRDHAASTRH